MRIFHLLGLMVLLLSSCDTSGTYLISEVTFKNNNLSEHEKQEPSTSFLTKKFTLQLLKEK